MKKYRIIQHRDNKRYYVQRRYFNLFWFTIIDSKSFDLVDCEAWVENTLIARKNEPKIKVIQSFLIEN